MTDFTNWSNSKIDSNKITIDGFFTGIPEPKLSGVYLPVTIFEPNTNYEMTFDYLVLEGSIHHLGGHFALSDNTKVYVDGKLINSDWHNPRFENFTQEKGKHVVKIVFNTNRFDSPISSDTNLPTADKRFYIQPNRFKHNTDYKIELSNFKLIKH